MIESDINFSVKRNTNVVILIKRIQLLYFSNLINFKSVLLFS